MMVSYKIKMTIINNKINFILRDIENKIKHYHFILTGYSYDSFYPPLSKFGKSYLIPLLRFNTVFLMSVFYCGFER